LEQYRTSYEEWTDAFLRAVRKRAVHGRQRPSVFLSSGYDSGAICLALNLAGIAYDTFSIDAGENQEVLDQRIQLNLAASCEAAFRLPGLQPADVERVAHELVRETEPFLYQHEDAPGAVTSLHADQGALGAHVLAGFARSKRRVVNLSGTGADEILSDYGFAGTKFYYHSEFGGLFPDDLTSIFPWKKFYGDTQRSYLFKDEFVLGRHGIEGRYPFLDKQVVQEFLSLSAALKNRTYKAPLEHFLRTHGYPFEPLKKRGFSPVVRD
jgi:asparagine synthetase B (glutamine-hydrolysing)